MKHRTGSSVRGGFSLLELVIVLALISMMVGVSVPVAGTMLRRKARVATSEELLVLGEAARAHFEDTGALPSDHDDLLSSTALGWAGPYLTGVLDDRRTGLSGYRVDGWSNDYRWVVAGDLLTLTSAGGDGTLDTSDDIELKIDVTPIRRQVTLERMDALRIAINHYNAAYLSTDPLPADWSQIVTRLTVEGFLPSGSNLVSDGWGDDFVPDPPVSPVHDITSSHL